MPSRAAGPARNHRRGSSVRARLLHRVRGARRQRQRDRRADARFTPDRSRSGRHRHHRHGPAFSRADADRVADAREAAGDRKAGRPVGRLSDGAGLRARLDAVHRPDPCRHSGDGGLARRRSPRAPVCWRSIRSASAFRLWSRRFAVEPFAAFLARFRAHLGLVEQAMGGLLVLTGIAFLTGTSARRVSGCCETFPALGKIG